MWAELSSLVFNFELYKLKNCSSWPKHTANISGEFHIVCIRMKQEMASDISLMQFHLSYNKCEQSPVFPQLCTDPSERGRGCLLILPRLFPSDILPQMLPCMFTVSGHLCHMCYFFSKANSRISLALFQLLHRPLYVLLCSSFFVLFLSLSCVCVLLH